MIQQGMSDGDYRAIDALSQSRLWLMRKSPMHYKINPKFESDAMQFGTVFHMALLEPKKFRESYLVEPEMITINGKETEVNKRVKAHRDYLEAWRLDNPNSVILNDKQMDSLTGMLTEIQKDKDLVEIITLGSTEVVSLWDYNGRKCKGKADVYCEHPKYGKIVIDFKKTQDASESGFTRSVYNYGYSLQAAWYREGFEADRFFFVAVEERGLLDPNTNKSRHPIGKWDADPWLEQGKNTMNALMERLALCEQNDSWPWYSSGFELLRPPTWVSGMDDEQK